MAKQESRAAFGKGRAVFSGVMRQSVFVYSSSDIDLMGKGAHYGGV
jgi:hypothetical protein